MDKPNKWSNIIGLGQLVVMLLTVIVVPMYLGGMNAEFKQVQVDNRAQRDAIAQLVTVSSAQAVVAATHQARLDAHDRELERLQQLQQLQQHQQRNQ